MLVGQSRTLVPKDIRYPQRMNPAGSHLELSSGAVIIFGLDSKDS